MLPRGFGVLPLRGHGQSYPRRGNGKAKRERTLHRGREVLPRLVAARSDTGTASFQVEMKRILRSILASQYCAPLWYPLARGRVSIFTLHRFAVPDLGVSGHDPAVLEATLVRLRRGGYKLLSLTQVLEGLQNPSQLTGRDVAFTVDDGYADFGLVGAGIFLANDCPVTVFLTTGFVDGRLWQWWDQVEFVLLNAEKPEVEVTVGERMVTIRLGDSAQRQSETHRLWALFKQIPDTEKWAGISHLAAAAGVEIPAQAPPQYAPMSWDEVRALEACAVTFGPHTDSHPILPQTTDAVSHHQISHSWGILQNRLESPVPILAYPNGWASHREFENVRRCGLSAGLTTEPEYATSRAFLTSPDGRFSIPRFGYPEEPERVRLITSGFHRIRRIMRGTGPGDFVE